MQSLAMARLLSTLFVIVGVISPEFAANAAIFGENTYQVLTCAKSCSAATGMNGCWSEKMSPLSNGTAMALKKDGSLMTPHRALSLLVEGNRRYLEGGIKMRSYYPIGEKFANGQAPFAAILSCADSRVSPSLIFDLAPGSIFQVRVAGNAVYPQVLGSLEYAVAMFNVSLIAVMGHSNCGAVFSAIRAYEVDSTNPEIAFPPAHYGSIAQVCQAIYRAIDSVQAQNRTVSTVTEKNVALQVRTLVKAAPILSRAVQEGRLAIVGAEYMISSDPRIDGRVRFLP